MTHLAVNVLIVTGCIAAIALIVAQSFFGSNSILFLEPQFAVSGEILFIGISGTVVALLILALKGRE